MLSDIFFVLRKGLPAGRRPGLVQQMHLGLPYWVMQPDSARLPVDSTHR
ncbi:MAG: hypothetical protein HYS13_23050 [Planctomycetia bacterium]|nr:hypothetical protein [Planctomycetia bacterium]